MTEARCRLGHCYATRRSRGRNFRLTSHIGVRYMRELDKPAPSRRSLGHRPGRCGNPENMKEDCDSFEDRWAHHGSLGSSPAHFGYNLERNKHGPQEYQGTQRSDTGLSQSSTNGRVLCSHSQYPAGKTSRRRYSKCGEQSQSCPCARRVVTRDLPSHQMTHPPANYSTTGRRLFRPGPMFQQTTRSALNRHVPTGRSRSSGAQGCQRTHYGRELRHARLRDRARRRNRRHVQNDRHDRIDHHG